jgi:hypothetical protein
VNALLFPLTSDVSDKDSLSSLSENDSALTGYTNHISIYTKSGSSIEICDDHSESRQSPQRSIAKKTVQAAVSHGMLPRDFPEIIITDEGENASVQLPKGQPFQQYGTPSPHTMVKEWLEVQEQKRLSSPSGSTCSDDSFYSAMDMQV